MQRGFSLIELSITLAIIGILIAGVVSGSKLIEQAKMQKAIKSINNANRAIEIFKVTYDAMPGDINNATSYWSGVSNGNASGAVDSFWESAQYIWVHLEKAKLYDILIDSVGGETRFGATTNADKIALWKYDGINVVGSTYQGVSLGMTKNSQVQIIDLSNHYLKDATFNYYGISAKMSFLLDRKMDDGIANTGNIISNISVGTITNEQECGTASTYDIVNNRSCVLLYDLPSLRKPS